MRSPLNKIRNNILTIEICPEKIADKTKNAASRAIEEANNAASRAIEEANNAASRATEEANNAASRAIEEANNAASRAIEEANNAASRAIEEADIKVKRAVYSRDRLALAALSTANNTWILPLDSSLVGLATLGDLRAVGATGGKARRDLSDRLHGNGGVIGGGLGRTGDVLHIQKRHIFSHWKRAFSWNIERVKQAKGRMTRATKTIFCFISAHLTNALKRCLRQWHLNILRERDREREKEVELMAAVTLEVQKGEVRRRKEIENMEELWMSEIEDIKRSMQVTSRIGEDSIDSLRQALRDRYIALLQ